MYPRKCQDHRPRDEFDADQRLVHGRRNEQTCEILFATVNRFGKNSSVMTIRLLFVAFLLTSPALFSVETAQPELPVATLTIGQTSIKAEVADDDAERSSGLMFRESLAPDSGMLFVMPSVAAASFWMKNTLIPLSIAFLDENGTILEIHDMQPKSEKIIKSTFTRIAYALEMQQGWFGKKNIWPGEKVTGLPRPPQS